MTISAYWLRINIMIHQDYENTIKFYVDFSLMETACLLILTIFYNGII